MTVLLGKVSLLKTYRHESRFSLKIFSLFLCLILGQGVLAKSFKFTLLQDPTTLDPQMLSSASGNYITTLLYRGLYQWKNNVLVPDEGKCRFKNIKELSCIISDKAKWSDGTPVTASDYKRSFLFLLNQKNASPQASMLFKIKGASQVFSKQADPNKLGFEILSSKKFSILFESPDAEFLYKFVHPALYPRHSSYKKGFHAKKNLISNGYFKIKEFKRGQRFLLERNSYVSKNSRLIQEVEALIVESDTTSLHLFEAGKIQFLRRLTADQFNRFSNKKSFHQFPVLRFDYIGFGPALHKFPKLREAFASGFEAKGFQTLFSTEGKPGCPSIPQAFYTGDPCFKKSLNKSIEWPKNLKLVLGYSEMGGEDIKRAAEWFQGQWKTHLGVQADLQSREQKVYLNWLRSNPPALFRKGLSLDRPTCLAALENFSKDHPENYIQFDHPEFQMILKKLSKTLSGKKTKKLCEKGLKLLISQAWLIPLGEMKFTILVDPQFTGWSLNSLNQLQLRDLRSVKK